MKNPNVTLHDKYDVTSGSVFMTGIQALVRLPLDQIRRDREAGHNTGGFISGYRGSPLGGYDQELSRARGRLADHGVVFEPGLNEDLAATAVWGSQHTSVFPGAKREGVFGIWYGKAPGVDRTGDAFKHANNAGTSPLGGVLALAGDDHTCKSSTLASQSEFAFMDAEIPVLSPADVQEVLDYGLLGIAMSRYSGAWTGFIALADTMDSGAVIAVDPSRAVPVAMGEALDVHIRGHDSPLAKEERLRHVKLPAAQRFVRANGLDQVRVGRAGSRFGIVTSGKAYLDVIEALRLLGLTPEQAGERGLAIYKVAMPWPLEPQGMQSFAEGSERLLVIEHKRALMEPQIRDALYALPDKKRPAILGKRDGEGAPLLSDLKELTPMDIARALARVLPDAMGWQGLDARVAELESRAERLERILPSAVRSPYYCSGCPHNTSTTVPEGSRALAGIGCHYMASFMPERNTDMASQMGGEGVPWIGHAPFTEEQHVFTNLGDGTYAHSGILAVRAAVAAKSNITFKLLYNDAVAMTGGQAAEGNFTVAEICQQLAAERVQSITVVTDEPERYTRKVRATLPKGVRVEDRDNLDSVQKALRETEGVTVLLYDQTCATEKRRRRKRGKMPPATQRTFINQRVCEGCGDCSAKSSCLSVEPVETLFGPKRRINQATCNTDLSCVKGFCPSFVTIEGEQVAPVKPEPKAMPDVSAGFPEPERATDRGVHDVLIAGVGGMGVTTAAAVLAMAAHMEGRSAKTLDMTGLAQKGGAVFSHIRIGGSDAPAAARVPNFSCDVLLGGDAIVAASPEAAAYLHDKRTKAVVNLDIPPTAEFLSNPRKRWDALHLAKQVKDRCAGAETFDAGAVAETYFGDGVFVNALLLGHAYQRGLIPIGADAIEQAFRLNGAAVEANLSAFRFGRHIAVHGMPDTQSRVQGDEEPEPESLEALVERMARELTDYHNAAYAKRYRDLMAHVTGQAEAVAGGERFARGVARYGYKLMAFKDEWEVARLYADPAYKKALSEAFTGVKTVKLHLAPPLLSKKDPETGELQKRAFGPWVFQAMALMAKFRFLRGTPVDIFSKTAERKMERRLRDEYETLMRDLADTLTPQRLETSVALAELPDMVRGYGHVKDRNVEHYEAEKARLIARLDEAGDDAGEERETPLLIAAE